MTTAQCFVGHAMHPDWRAALALAAAQIDGQRARQDGDAPLPPTLGLVYFSDRYAGEAEALYAALRERWPGASWAGTVGVGVCAGGVEYFDEPALVLMLCTLPAARFRVFSGAQPLGHGVEAAASALVHADSQTHDLAELLAELAGRTTTGYLFGGLGSSRTRSCQIADGVYEGGLSGVAFTRDVGLVSRVTQGSQPVGPTRRITACERNVVTGLDGQPALECLLADLGLALDRPEARSRVIATLRGTLVGLAAPRAPLSPHASTDVLPRHRAFGDDVRVRHLIGLDPGRHGVAVAELVEPGMTLAFCQRDVAAARRDLIRICAEIRDELAPEPVLAAAAGGAGAPHDEGAILDPATRVAGAIYVSCAGRGGPHFGAPSAELQIVRHALGDVPLVGFFAAGEIGHQQLYGYTGVLTVLTRGD